MRLGSRLLWDSRRELKCDTYQRFSELHTRRTSYLNQVGK
jgi:hypothetical protein